MSFKIWDTSESSIMFQSIFIFKSFKKKNSTIKSEKLEQVKVIIN